MSMASSVGLVSGIDFNSIILRLLAVEQRPAQTLVNQRMTYESKKAAYESINRKLEALSTALEAINEIQDFNSLAATVSDSSVITASLSDDATEGMFDVTVLQLARADRYASQGFVDEDLTAVAAASGTFSFKMGIDGETVSIDVDTSTTLADLRNAINTATDDVTASIVNDGSPTNPYRMVLTGTNTGKENEITIITNDTTLNFSTTEIEAAAADESNTFDGTVTSSGTYTGTTSKQYVVEMTTGGAIGAAQFRVSEDGGATWSDADAFTTSASPTNIYATTDEGVQISFGAGTENFEVGDKFYIDAFAPHLQSAQDAHLKVDGIAVSRISNTIDDVITGVTLTLLDTDTSPVTVNVSNYHQNATGLIVEAVNKYNDLIREINSQSNFDVENNLAGPLFTDSTTRGLKRYLGDIISSAIPGLTAEFNAFAQIGITTGEDGTLLTDMSALQNAIDENFENVIRIFALTGESTHPDIQFMTSEDLTLTGNFSVEVVTAAAQASVSGNQAIAVGGIVEDELLTFTYEDMEILVTLTAGDTMDDVVDKINNAMIDEAAAIRAYDSSGTLLLKTLDYGSIASFSVVSDKDGGTENQTGIGTTIHEETGTDIVALINNIQATGDGQEVTGIDGTSIEGLKLKITASSSGFLGNVEVSSGITPRLLNEMARYTDEDGYISARTDGIDATIENINDRIERMEGRLEAMREQWTRQFTRLESILAGYQTQSMFLQQQLAGLMFM